MAGVLFFVNALPEEFNLFLENILTCLDETHRIHRNSAGKNFVMQMRPGAAAAIANQGDLLAVRDPLSLLDQDLAQMAVTGPDAVTMVDLDHAAIASIPRRQGNDSRRRGTHGGPQPRRQVNALMARPSP